MCYIIHMEEIHHIPPEREKHIYPVFDDELLRSILYTDADLNREMLDKISLSSVPKEELASCLDALTRDHLRDLATDHELYFSGSTRKQKIVDALTQRLVDRFPTLLSYLPLVNLEFLTRFQDSAKIAVSQDALLFRDVSHAQNFGFLFLYRAQNGYVAVVPRELLPALEMLKGETVWKAARFHQRLDAYAVSLSNLYGVLDIDQLALVWNRFEQEIMTPAMMADELSVLEQVQYYWWLGDELVISSYFQSIDEVNEFLKHVKEIPYYTPSREDLVHYYQTPYDDKSPAANAMMEFLSGYVLPKGGSIEDLMDDLSDACIAGNAMQDVFNLLNEYGLLFTQMDEIVQFTELFTQLSEQSRKWELRGHTPSAFKEHSSSR